MTRYMVNHRVRERHVVASVVKAPPCKQLRLQAYASPPV
jgi:hypothetical protein